MMIASRGQRGTSNTAPSTIFTTTSQLSPRQIANKAMTLGCKKLDRDDKRSRPQYNLRERLLICNTIANAEQVLNRRTRRTNRRVMAAEDDDDSYFEDHALTSSPTLPSLSSSSSSSSSSIDQNDHNTLSNHHRHHHQEDTTSPLRSSLDDINDDDQKIIEDHSSDRIPTNSFQKWDNNNQRMTTCSPIVAL